MIDVLFPDLITSAISIIVLTVAALLVYTLIVLAWGRLEHRNETRWRARANGRGL